MLGPRLNITPISRPAWLAAGSVFAITTPLYLATMNRTIGFIDRGELAAVASTLGIAHPTGYPTLTLLGWLVTHVAPLRPVLALNALAALLVAAGAAVMTLLLDQVIGRLDSPGPGEAPARSDMGSGDRARMSESLRATCAALAALFIAATETWWQQANGFEAYALHALFLPLVVLLYLRFASRLSAAVERETTIVPAEALLTTRAARVGGHLFAFTLGLSFTNHMTTVLLLPALLVDYFGRCGARRSAIARLARLAPAFLLGLLPYAWIPIRSAMNPRFDWGNPQTLRSFLDHWTGRQYQGWMFSSFESFRRQLGYWLAHLPWELAFAGLLVAAAGAWLLVRRDRRLAVFAALLLATSVLYGSGYRIRDIDAYFLTGHLALALAVGAGLVTLRRWARPEVVVAVGVALAVSNLALHYRTCDESGNVLVEDLTRNLLEPLPPNAVLFTDQWEYGLSASYYFQTVEKLRPDVLVVCPMLAGHAWYLDELERRDRAFVRRVAPAVERFDGALDAFERGEARDPRVLRTAKTKLLDAMMDPAVAGRPVFVTGEIDPALAASYRREPFGLALRLVSGAALEAPRPPVMRWRPWRNRADHYAVTVSWIYAQNAAARMIEEARGGHSRRAEAYRRYALCFDPGLAMADLPPLPQECRELAAQGIRFFADLRHFDPDPRAALR